MVSERIQRRIDALLDEPDAAVTAQDWPRVAGAARAVLAIDDTNADAAAFLKMALANGISDGPPIPSPSTGEEATTVVGGGHPVPPPPLRSPAAERHLQQVGLGGEAPTSFANGRYAVKRFLGEGGKKRSTSPTTSCSTVTSPSR
jgi:hypothetical protein